MPSNIVDVLAVAAMHVKYGNVTDNAGIPFDSAGKILSIGMMVPGGTIDEFSLVNTGTDWMLANEHTLVCPASFSGRLARVAFYYTRNLVLSYELSDYSSVLDAEFTDAQGWDDVIGKILAVPEVNVFLSSNQADDNTRLPAITANGVTDDLVQKVQDAIAAWSPNTLPVKQDFPLAGLPFVLQELQTSKESAEGVFPFDRGAAHRLLLSLGPAANSKAELQRMVQIATDYRMRTGAGLELTEQQKKQLQIFMRYVSAFGTLPAIIGNSPSIVDAKENVSKRLLNVGLTTQPVLDRAVANVKSILKI